MRILTVGLVAILLVAGASVARAGDVAQASIDAYEQGEAAWESGRWQEAADAYWAAVEADLRNFDAHIRYQQASRRNAVSEKDLKADYDSFVADFPDEVDFRLHRLRLEKTEERLGKLEALRAGNADSDELLLEIARCRLEAGDEGKAVRILAPLVKKGRGGDRAFLLLVRANLAKKKGGDAGKLLQKRLAQSPSPAIRLAAARYALATGDYDDALREATAVLEARPASTAALLVKSEAEERRGQRDAAISTLEVARRTTEDATPVLLALADLVGRGEDEDAALKAAMELYEKVLAADAENTRALYGKAWVLERLAKFEEAETVYREVAQFLPVDPSVVESVGYMLFQQGRISDAQVQFKKAIDLDPDYASAYANLGATFDAKAEYQKAIAWYEKLLKVRGQEENLRALINLAFDHEQLGSFPKAEKYLRRANEISPLDADILTWLGDNLYFQEKWKDAQKAYLKALDLNEKSFFAWRGLGYALGQMGRWSDAAAALENAKDLKPDDLELLLTLGGIYLEEVEDLEAALKAFEEYVQNGGDDPAIPDVITEIKKQLE